MARRGAQGFPVVVLAATLAAWAAQEEPQRSSAPELYGPTPVQEVVLGERALEQFLATRRLSDDAALALRVDRIGNAVARVSDRPDVLYSFLVVAGAELQAYSFTGGAVCLTDSLARLGASDDELAFAIAHELAHVALRHHVSKGLFEQVLEAEGVGKAARVVTLHDRGAEMEADRYGALYACRAGFRFSASYDLLERLSQAARGPDRDPAHPGYADRIAGLKQFRRELEHSLAAFERGKKALTEGRADEAVNMLALFAASFPESIGARVNLGAAYLERVRRVGGTPGGLAEVVPFLPDSGVVVRGSFAAIDLERAKEHFEKALSLEPDEINARLGMALVVLREGDRDRARRILEPLVSASRTPEVLLCLGNVEFLDGNYDEAVGRYEEALEARPGWPAAQKNLALTHEARKRLSVAKPG